MAKSKVTQVAIAILADKKRVKQFQKILKALTKPRKLVIKIEKDTASIRKFAQDINKLKKTKKIEIPVGIKIDKAASRRLGKKINALGKGKTIPINFKTNLPQVAKKVDGVVAKLASRTRRVLGGAFKIGIGLGIAALGVSRLAAASQDFGRELAAIGTLEKLTIQETKNLRKEVLALSNDTGIAAAEVAKGLYQAISAGATDAAHSTEFMRKATALAIGGVSTLEESVTLLAGVMNTYGVGLDRATQISNILFTTVKDGTTTIPELAQSLGTVLPVAEAMGFSLEEATAAVAALTKAGRDTAKATVQVTAFMNSIIKASPEVRKKAREMGIDLSLAGVRAKGLAGFLEELKEKTGGSAEALNVIFKESRALKGVLSLTGQSFEEFNKILDDNRDSANATADALAVIQASQENQADVMLNKLKNIGIEIGTKVVGGIVKFVEEMGGAEILTLKLQKIWLGIRLAVFGVKKVFQGVGLALASVLSVSLKIQRVQQNISTLGIGNTKELDKWITNIDEFKDQMAESVVETEELNEITSQFSKLQNRILTIESNRDRNRKKAKEEEKAASEEIKTKETALARAARQRLATQQKLNEEKKKSKKLAVEAVKAERDRLAVIKSTASEFLSLNAAQRRQRAEIAKTLSTGSFAEFKKLIDLQETRKIISGSSSLKNIVQARGFGQKLAGESGILQTLQNTQQQKTLKIENDIKISLEGEAVIKAITEKLAPIVFEVIERGKNLIAGVFDAEATTSQAAQTSALTGN